MNGNTEPTSPSEIPRGEPDLEDAETPDRLDPKKIRVVDVENKETGEILRWDCYDPDGGGAEMGDVMRLEDGELWLRTIDWARSDIPGAEPLLFWKTTGLPKEKIGRIGVFTWPVGESVQIFADKKKEDPR